MPVGGKMLPFSCKALAPAAALISGVGMGRAASRAQKAYGRKYVIRWDTEAKVHRVTLGSESIGFDDTEEGAREIAVAHAHHVWLESARGTSSISVATQSGKSKESQ